MTYESVENGIRKKCRNQKTLSTQKCRIEKNNVKQKWRNWKFDISNHFFVKYEEKLDAMTRMANYFQCSKKCRKLE
jgi:vacuolar-type H+-ATPase subunit E/Vma4